MECLNPNCDMVLGNGEKFCPGCGQPQTGELEPSPKSVKESDDAAAPFAGTRYQ